MTAEEFNKKWEKHLEKGHYGMDIHNDEVIDYMDKEFTEEVKTNPNFTYTQIKLKFNMARVYVESDNASKWEKAIDEMLK